MTRWTLIYILLLLGCKEEKKTIQTLEDKVESTATMTIRKPQGIQTPKGMVWVKGGSFYQGAVSKDKMAMTHEKPRHKVLLDGFFMDEHEVTNAQFAQFVEETGYETVAERKIEWEEMKKQLPPDTPKPHDSILQPGSLVFKKTKTSVPNLYDYSQWWEWKIGANWKHPYGPESSIEGLEDHPVVHLAYEDALAYCEWKGHRLPTEAEWEYAARAGQEDAVFTWGSSFELLSANTNSWEGEFPVENTMNDGFERRAPVKSYPPNPFGLYDMAGNVWEWTSDWYNTQYYQELNQNGVAVNPKGAERAYNTNNPYQQEKIIKGGSFLCSDSYCASYRISARMATSTDSGAEHTGFRTVLDTKMLDSGSK